MTVAPTTDPSAVRRFWAHMIRRHPRELGHDGKARAEITRWHPIDQFDLIVSITMGRKFVRVFIRGIADGKASIVRKRLEAVESELMKTLGVPLKSAEQDHFFVDRLDVDLTEETNWDAATDWLFERAEKYEVVLNLYLGRNG